MTERTSVGLRGGELKPESVGLGSSDLGVSPKKENTSQEVTITENDSFIPKWLTYLAVISIWAGTGFFSLVLAALSINTTVIAIFLLSVVVSLIFTVMMVSRKVWLAYVFSVAHLPTGFLFSYMYYYIWGT